MIQLIWIRKNTTFHTLRVWTGGKKKQNVNRKFHLNEQQHLQNTLENSWCKVPVSESGTQTFERISTRLFYLFVLL